MNRVPTGFKFVFGLLGTVVGFIVFTSLAMFLGRGSEPPSLKAAGVTPLPEKLSIVGTRAECSQIPQESGLCSTSVVISGSPSESDNLRALNAHLKTMGWSVQLNAKPDTVSGCRYGWQGLRFFRFCLSAYSLGFHVKKWEINGVLPEETLDEFGISPEHLAPGQLHLAVITARGLGPRRGTPVLVQ